MRAWWKIVHATSMVARVSGHSVPNFSAVDILLQKMLKIAK